MPSAAAGLVAPRPCTTDGPDGDDARFPDVDDDWDCSPRADAPEVDSRDVLEDVRKRRDMAANHG